METFDAKRWIVLNLPDARGLTTPTLKVVSSFTLMWNLFENYVCGTDFKIDKFEKVAETIARRTPLPEAVSEGIRFWTERYRAGSRFNFLFDGLQFRPNDRKQLVEAVLSGTQTEPHRQLLAAVIIVYRLRNNLFHGTKTVPTLNDQASNLDMACRTLAAVIKVSLEGGSSAGRLY